MSGAAGARNDARGPRCKAKSPEGVSSPLSLSYVVLGGGAQGRAVARDLAVRRDTGAVVVVDPFAPRIPAKFRKIRHAPLDALTERGAVARLVREADACVIALPGSIADGAIPDVLPMGTPVVDMSFTPEAANPRFDRIARRSGVPLVRDVGVAPGLSHVIAAVAARELGGLTHLTIYVGGLPQKVPAPKGAFDFRHAVYFNAEDLMAEYLRPARMRRRGRNAAPDPLAPSETEHLKDGSLGTLEAFPSDGLRTLLDSFSDCGWMRELTLRWPGHLTAMRTLKKEGRLAEGPTRPSALAKTAAELAKAYPAERNPDVLLMEVHAQRGARRLDFRLIDRAQGGLTAMSRTTAFTGAAAAHLLALRRFDIPGSHPPEALGQHDDLAQALLADLKERKITVERGSRLRVGA